MEITDLKILIATSVREYGKIARGQIIYEFRTKYIDLVSKLTDAENLSTNNIYDLAILSVGQEDGQHMQNYAGSDIAYNILQNNPLAQILGVCELPNECNLDCENFWESKEFNFSNIGLEINLQEELKQNLEQIFQNMKISNYTPVISRR